MQSENLSNILRLDPHTPDQNAMIKYFDAPYILTKVKPKTTSASLEIVLNNGKDLAKLRMLAADKKM